jgi:cysteinyl-tRNA synthetase
MIAGARVEVAPYKKSPADFVLWKPSGDDQPGWNSPWGRGRPGWHIECSAMIAESLGTTIDIHGGGQDLQFPHHENELAQSTCAHDGAPLAQIWMHNGFLNMGSAEKMSKSLGNIRTIPELQAEGWSGEVLRLALLSAHYRQPLEWTAELLSETKSRLDRWCEAVGDDDSLGGGSVPVSVVEALSDDLNTPAAMRALSELASMIFAASGSERFELRRQFVAAGRLLGIGKLALRTLPSGVSMDWVDTQIAANSAYRAARDFVRADAVRAELASRGIMLVITRDGTTWRRA